jgi:hypothetical protein
MARTNADFRQLVATPSERLDVEYKQWLNLDDAEHVGLLAKAAIAQANHGGGEIVIGFQPKPLESYPRPAEIPLYTQDQINGLIRRYLSVNVHCELTWERHPTTGVEHAIVSVPGGHRVPIMSKRNTPKQTLRLHTYYIRRAGPESSPPETFEDWDALLERCLRNRKDDLLDAIRGIVEGQASSNVERTPADDVLQDTFRDGSRARWQELVNPLPQDSPARFPLGFYETDFYLNVAAVRPSLNALLREMTEASQVRHTGWSPFWQPNKPEIAPRPYDDSLEAWFSPEHTAAPDPAHCDYWRVGRDSRFYRVRGYDEDGGHYGWQPGAIIDLTIPIWRTGENLLYAMRYARAAGDDDATIDFRVRFTGLLGRELKARERYLRDGRISGTDEITVRGSATVRQLDENLPEVVHPLLAPVYERFSLFELPKLVVVEELAKLRKNQF